MDLNEKTTDLIVNKQETNCHTGDQDNQNHKGHSKNHMLMMLLCCLAPIALIAILPLVGFKNISGGFLILLLCPLMHVGMMFSMKKKKN